MDPANPETDVPLDMFPTYRPPVLPTPQPVVPEEDDSKFGFTMQSVCQELEELKNQMAAPSSSTKKRKKCGNRARKSKKMHSPAKDESTSDYQYSLPEPSGTFDPWTFFNKEITFIIFNRSMRDITDERLVEMACAEIGNRIAFHKQKHQETNDRLHIYYKNKLNEFKTQVDRIKAIVLLYVLQNLKPEDIQALERQLFPLPARLFSFLT